MLRVDKSDALKRDFPVILEKAMGIVSKACEDANISRQTYYRWRSEDTDFSKRCDEVGEYVIDRVESILFQKIMKDKDTPSTIFYLKTKAKHRGYVERVESTGRDGNAIDVSVTPLQERNFAIINKVTNVE